MKPIAVVTIKIDPNPMVPINNLNGATPFRYLIASICDPQRYADRDPSDIESPGNSVPAEVTPAQPR